MPWLPPSLLQVLNRLQLLTAKEVVYLVNLSKRDYLRKANKWLPKVQAKVEELGGGQMIPFSVEFEQEVSTRRALAPPFPPPPSWIPVRTTVQTSPGQALDVSSVSWVEQGVVSTRGWSNRSPASRACIPGRCG